MKITELGTLLKPASQTPEVDLKKEERVIRVTTFTTMKEFIDEEYII